MTEARYAQQVRYAYVKAAACKHQRMQMYEKFNKYVGVEINFKQLQYVGISFHPKLCACI